MVRLCILAMLSPLLLSGCGESFPRGYGGSPSSETLKPVAAPPGADEQPPLAGMTGAPKTPDGLPALTAKGTNTTLFSAKMNDEADRIDRLENAVQELRNDFDAMAPAIVRLVSIEKDMQNLISQLEILTSGGAPAPIPPIEESALEQPEPVQPAGVPLPPVAAPSVPSEDSMPMPLTQNSQPQSPAQEPTAVTPAPPTAITPPVEAQAAATAAPAPLSPAKNASAVQSIRIGEHPGKVRIVLDVGGKTSFTADLDNGEKILVIELPDAAWAAKPLMNFTGNPVLVSYKTESMGNTGTRLIITLKTKTDIVYKSLMDNPAGGTSKIVIDLATPKK